jgi:predicted esterase
MKCNFLRGTVVTWLAVAGASCTGSIDDSSSMAADFGLRDGGSEDDGSSAPRGVEDPTGAEVPSDGGTSGDAPATSNDAGRATDAGPATDAARPRDAGPVSVDSGGGTIMPMPTSGCGQTPPVTGMKAQTISVGGQNRGYEITIPTGYNNQTPYAVIFAYHGRGDKGANFRTFLNLEKTTENKAIFIYPDGLDVGGGTGWSLGESGSDVKMFDAVLADVSSKYCVDQKAIFAVGFSYGGWMSNAIGCYRKIGAMAEIAGGGPNGKCVGPTPAMIIHGSMDTAEPPVAGERSRDSWRTTNTCSATSTAAAPAPCVAYSGCAKPLYYCVHPGGHEVPGFAQSGLWAWFSAQR